MKRLGEFPLRISPEELLNWEFNPPKVDFPRVKNLFIKRREDFKIKESLENLNPDYVVDGYLCNDGGEFYGPSGHYLYLFKVPAGVDGMRIVANEICGLSNIMVAWPKGNFFYTDAVFEECSSSSSIDKQKKICYNSSDNGLKFILLQDSDIAKDPNRSCISCVRWNLRYLPGDFVGDDEKKSSCDFAEPKTFRVPKEFAESGQKKWTLLFAVPSSIPPAKVKDDLKVRSFTYDTGNECYIDEAPVAEALYEGELFRKSRIKFGCVKRNGGLVEGEWSWPRFILNHAIRVGECGVKTCPAAFYETKNNMSKFVGWFVLDIPVYRNVKSGTEVFIWNKDTVARSDTLRDKPTVDRRFPNFFDSYSLERIYQSVECFDYISPEQAARIVGRNLLVQPRGRRSLSVEGSALKLLMGGVIEMADRALLLLDKLKEKGKGNINQKIEVAEKMNRYLYSMSYFGNNSTEGGRDCTAGRIFYDAPIHFDRPETTSENETQETTDVIRITGELVQGVLRRMFESENVGLKKVGEPVSGCEAIKTLLDRIMKELSTYDIGVDYIYSDFELMRSTASEINKRFGLNGGRDYSAWSGVWKDIRKYHNEIEKALLNRGYVCGDEYSETQKNGCELIDVAASCHSIVDYENGVVKKESSCGYNLGGGSKTYAKRRNVNIWDCVMLEYTSNLFNDCIVEPVRSRFPKVISSIHALNNQAGCVNHHQHATEFETYLGGSVKLVGGMRSNPCLYGLKLNAFEKESMDNWKTFIPEVTPFARLVTCVNNVRAAKMSNGNVAVHPFIATQYTWNRFVKGNAPIYRNLYKEMLIHSWMCNPEITYAYIDYKYDNEEGDAGPDSLRYFNESRRMIQETLNEVNEMNEKFGVIRKIKPILKYHDIRPSRKRLLLTDKCEIVPENSSFILSGRKRRNDITYRLSYDVKKCRFKYSPCFRKGAKVLYKTIVAHVDGKSIVFRNAEMLSKYNEMSSGVWIRCKGAAALVKTDPEYFEKHPSLSESKNLYQSPLLAKTKFDAENPEKEYGVRNRIAVADNTSVFGDIASEQKWVMTVKNEGVKKGSFVFGIKLEDDFVYKSEGEYEFTAMVNLNRARDKTELNVSLECGNKNCGSGEGTVYLGESKCKGVFALWPSLIPDRGFAEIPLLRREVDGKMTESNDKLITGLKAYIMGNNARIDVYRESDGVNISRVNPGNTSNDFRPTDTNDSFVVKLSFLNASQETSTYRVVLSGCSGTEELITTTVEPGDEGSMQVRCLRNLFSKGYDKVNLYKGCCMIQSENLR